MSKNIRVLYLYIISFIALWMIIGGFVGVVNNVAAYKYPTVDYYGEEYYPNSSSSSNSFYEGSEAVGNYKQGLENKENSVKLRSIKNIFNALTVLLVSIPLFAYHFSKIEKERKEEEVLK